MWALFKCSLIFLFFFIFYLFIWVFLFIISAIKGIRWLPQPNRWLYASFLVCHSFAKLPLPKELTLKRQQTNCISLLVLFQLRQIDNRSFVLYLTAQAIKEAEGKRDDAGNNSVLLSCFVSFSFFQVRVWAGCGDWLLAVSWQLPRWAQTPSVLISLVYGLCTHLS